MFLNQAFQAVGTVIVVSSVTPFFVAFLIPLSKLLFYLLCVVLTLFEQPMFFTFHNNIICGPRVNFSDLSPFLGRPFMLSFLVCWREVREKLVQ
jgi:hypothetical protein